jgi:hypothetical protein
MPASASSFAVCGDRGKHLDLDNIRVHQGQYDARELRRWRETIRGVFSVPEVTGVGVFYEMNRLGIGVEGLAARPAIERRLMDLGVPLGMVAFREIPRPIPTQSTTLRHRFRPVIGGFRINDPCSVGASLVTAEFLTAAHCMIDPEATFGTHVVYQPDTVAVNNVIGQEYRTGPLSPCG